MRKDLELALKAIINAQKVRAFEGGTILCREIEPQAIAGLERLIQQEKQREVIAKAGYNIQKNVINGWYALLPGEFEFFGGDDEDTNHNYLGFFSSEQELLDEVSFEAEVAISKKIKATYLGSGCQRSDLDRAISSLMDECESMFEKEEDAMSFLMEESAEAC